LVQTCIDSMRLSPKSNFMRAPLLGEPATTSGWISAAGMRKHVCYWTRHSGMVRRTRPGISRFSDVQLHIAVRRCRGAPE
jgi:hypothetical protein